MKISYPARITISVSSSNLPDRLWGSPSLILNGYRGVMLTNHIHLAPTLRMSGAVSIFPLCAFMPLTETTLRYFCDSTCLLLPQH
jgi:hypothetical protein